MFLIGGNWRTSEESSLPGARRLGDLEGGAEEPTAARGVLACARGRPLLAGLVCAWWALVKCSGGGGGGR